MKAKLITTPGPKMYFATKDVYNEGSTRLHLDVTSAINILVHSESDQDAGADWTIFKREDSSKLREYLREKHSAERSDPIHSQQYFLTQADFNELAAREVYPFRFLQKYGHAVSIPAGCAHQVSRCRMSRLRDD